MALVLKDRVRETTTTAGTGTVTLAGAVTGFQSFAIIGNGNTTYYCISGQGTNEWEVGIGTYTSSGTTLARTTVLANSSATQPSALSFSAGTKDVFVTYPAEKSVNYDASDVVTITTLAATADSSFTSTGALLISKGTTGQQPGTPATGMLRYNTTTNEFEGYSGASPAWKSVGGSAISNDTTTSSNVYPALLGATTGTATNIYTSNAKLLYKPSTGEFQSSELVASNGLMVNNATVSASYTVASGTNAMSVGPMSVSSGVTVTVSSGQRWVVI